MLTEAEVHQKLAETESAYPKAKDPYKRAKLLGIQFALMTVLGITNEVDWSNRMNILIGTE